MVKHLTPDQRGRVAEKVMEWGNLVFAGLVISQLISSQTWNIWLGVLGFVLLVEAYGMAYLLMKRGGEK